MNTVDAKTATTPANGKAASRMAPPKAARQDAEAGAISLVRLGKDYVDLEIQGTTPYIPHKWSEKAKHMMPGHPEKGAISAKKGAHDIDAEREDCLYRLPDGRLGAPATAFKAAMIGACGLFDGITKVNTKIVLHVVGEGPDQLVPITGNLVGREDTPRNSNGSADLRYRYMVDDWSAIVRVEYIPTVITAESILALLDAAGNGGIGDWRPSAPKSATGTYGQWKVLRVVSMGDTGMGGA